MNYKRGWFREPYRHYLAAKGIQTSSQKRYFQFAGSTAFGRFLLASPERRKKREQESEAAIQARAKERVREAETPLTDVERKRAQRRIEGLLPRPAARTLLTKDDVFDKIEDLQDQVKKKQTFISNNQGDPEEQDELRAAKDFIETTVSRIDRLKQGIKEFEQTGEWPQDTRTSMVGSEIARVARDVQKGTKKAGQEKKNQGGKESKSEEEE